MTLTQARQEIAEIKERIKNAPWVHMARVLVFVFETLDAKGFFD